MRGLDIAEVSHVVNFEMPDEPADYMHRIGRTGRADKEGIAISFVSEKEDEVFEAIQQLMSIEVPIQPTPEELVVSTELMEFEKEKMGGDKFYYHEVIGFTVVDANFGEVGQIVYINDKAAQPLFEIDRDGTEIFIPMVDDFIKKVDRENKIIQVEAPEGLIALYI